MRDEQWLVSKEQEIIRLKRENKILSTTIFELEDKLESCWLAKNSYRKSYIAEKDKRVALEDRFLDTELDSVLDSNVIYKERAEKCRQVVESAAVKYQEALNSIKMMREAVQNIAKNVKKSEFQTGGKDEEQN